MRISDWSSDVCSSDLPSHPYPSGTRDVAFALAWIRANIAKYGGDTESIYLIGHSAGAAHAASYAYDRRYQPRSGHGLAGLVVVSGRVRADNSEDNPNARKVEEYYGKDSTQYDAMSAVAHVSAASPPTMIAFGIERESG